MPFADQPARAAPTRIGYPPIPHEHGAWVILYFSLLLGAGQAVMTAPMKVLFLVLAATGAFLAREALGLLLRRRGKPGTGFWLGIYLALFLGGALPLVVFNRVTSLLLIGAIAALLFSIHSRLLLRDRLDRSQWGEILGVGALTLTAPAAFAVTKGSLNGYALLLWVACLLYYSSSIFVVKMYLNAAKAKREWSEERRRSVGRDTLHYHILLTGALILLMFAVGGSSAVWLAAAYLPALVRAYWGRYTLTCVLPALNRVGMQELLLALWFTGCLLMATSGWHSR